MSKHENGQSLLRGVLAIAACLFVSVPASAREKRVWQYKTGSKAEAVLVSQDEKECTLRIVANSKEVKLLKKFLSPADQKYLRAEQLIEDDRAQWALVEDMLPKISTQPKITVDTLLQYHKQYAESPYAGLMAGIAMCLGENKHSTASVTFQNVKRRIIGQREYRPNVHTLTMASVLNNEAVCRIKSLKGSSAAALLLEAIEETGSVIPAVSHNGVSLAAVADGEAAKIVLDGTRRGKLLAKMGTAKTINTDRLPAGYYYSQLIDKPPAPVAPASAGSSSAKAPSRQIVAQMSFSGRSLAAMGSGWVVAPEWVITNSHVAEPNQLNSPTIAVLDDPSGAANKIAADKVIVSTSPALDLALLHVPGLSHPALPMVTTTPPQATELMVLGYPEATQFGLSLMTHSGVVSKRMPHEPTIVTDAKISSGNSGGPAIDRQGNVLGIAYASHLGGSTLVSQISAEKRGLLIDAVDATRWIKTVQPGIQLAPANSNATGNSNATASTTSTPSDWPTLVKQVGPSVLPILIYADPADIAKLNHAKARQSIGQAGANINPTALGMLRDHWCIACDGRGRIKCSYRGCGNGVISVKVRKKIGESLYGPIYGNVPVKTRCPGCSGRGADPCRQCRSGRI